MKLPGGIASDRAPYRWFDHTVRHSFIVDVLLGDLECRPCHSCHCFHSLDATKGPEPVEVHGQDSLINLHYEVDVEVSG